MKKVTMGILCSLLCVLTACGGSSGGDKSKSSSSKAVSSSSAAMSTASLATTSTKSSTDISTGTSTSVSSSTASVAPSSIPPTSTSTVPSSASGSSSSVVAQTGVFIDSAVAGVTYATSPGGFSGVTSATGQYQFAEGDTVTFSIGAIEFPPVTAKGVVTPVDMAQSGNLADPIVVNIAVLLQSLDVDGDPSNGISIPPAAATAAVQNVNFNQSYSAFQAEVLPVVQHTDSNKTVVSEAAASNHLADSIAEVNASALVGTWYIHGQGDGSVYDYALFIIDDHNYAAIDYDSTFAGSGAALEIGTYTWDQTTGKVAVTVTSKTPSELNAVPPMANDNTLVLNGNNLTLSDANETFELARLTPSATNPLKGGWSIINEEEQAFFAFTDTHYFMGQQSEADIAGHAGVELGTYTYHIETNTFVVDTDVDRNGQWGLSHPCAVLNGNNAHPNYEQSNYLACGPDGRDIVQTFTVTGDTLTFISEADTIDQGEDDPVTFERVNGVPDGDVHLKLELTLTLSEYTQGQKYTRDNGAASMQCDANIERELGDTEMVNESWVLGSNPNRPTWVSTVPATYNPATKKISFALHESVNPVPNHQGFYEESWEELDLTYNADENSVITGTYTEQYNLTWDRDNSVSTCASTYTVVGVLR